MLREDNRKMYFREDKTLFIRMGAKKKNNLHAKIVYFNVEKRTRPHIHVREYRPAQCATVGIVGFANTILC